MDRFLEIIEGHWKWICDHVLFRDLARQKLAIENVSALVDLVAKLRADGDDETANMVVAGLRRSLSENALIN